ncbi:hypothetical protein, partial [Ureibacillus manganicus]|uniref:hypothetical protein n=1 Tax=Ureibacillus manganicus TaxID=1266064 RepID=UPI00055D3FBC
PKAGSHASKKQIIARTTELIAKIPELIAKIYGIIANKPNSLNASLAKKAPPNPINKKTNFSPESRIDLYILNPNLFILIVQRRREKWAY